MNLTISGHHLEVTPALRGYVSDKLDRITRHFEQVMDVRVLLSVDNLKEKDRRQRAECNIKVKGGELHAESAHEDLYAAVDELVDKQYLKALPYDPVTGSATTWVIELPKEGIRGKVYNLHSGAPGANRYGQPFGEL